MKTSKTHQKFANWLTTPRALSNPDEFLGPNWKVVLNFWLYLDTLSDEQLNTAHRRYRALGWVNLDNAHDLAYEAALATLSMGMSYSVARSSPGDASGYASRELIGAHKILEQGQTLTIVPLFMDL